MGASCGVTKNSNQLSLSPSKLVRNSQTFMSSSKESLVTWRKMINSYRMNRQSKHFLLMVKQGPPKNCRWQAWLAIARPTKAEYEGLPLSSISSIKRDIHRTFPEEPHFNKNALLRILGKLSSSYEDIGYCQGMNYIAGFLLITSGEKESEVYSLMDKLLSEYSLKGLFKEDMPYLKKCLWVFGRLLRKERPVLAKHLENMLEEMWALKWFLTLFTANFKISLIERIWDLFLVDKMNALYRVAVSLLALFEDKLLDMETAQLYLFLKGIGYQIKDEEELIQGAAKTNFSNDDVKKLEKDYSFLTALSTQKENNGKHLSK